MNKENQTLKPFFYMNNAIDLYQKLKYDFNLLSVNKFNVYCYINFIFTAYHLKEWVNKDINMPINIKDKVNKTFNNRNREYRIIRSLCNKSKHFILDKRNIEIIKNKEVGFDFSRIDFDHFSFEPVYYIVKCKESDTDVELYDLCEKIFNDWTNILYEFIK